jgi:hypothetical protein
MKALDSTFANGYAIEEKKSSLLSRFKKLDKQPGRKPPAWVGIILAGHGCVITPITLLFIALAGNSMVLWAFTLAAMVMSLVVNLAAMPVKITVPVFLLSLLIDFGIIFYSIAAMVAA